jgi:hypothetical protein
LKFLECMFYILVNYLQYHLHEILQNFSLWVFLLGSLVSFIFVLLESGTGYPFSSFLSESYIKLFWGREWFPSLFLIPIAPLGTVQLCS